MDVMGKLGKEVSFEPDLEHAVDTNTCIRVGVLVAFGLSDRDICAALLLSNEQLSYAKETDEYKKSHALQVETRAMRAIDLEEGWDRLEERALATLHETLNFNKDPKFALQLAFTANRATRRSIAASGKIIDATKINNVIVLQMNQKFIEKKVTTPGNATIDITPNKSTLLPKKQHDIPTPKRVSELLGIVLPQQKTDEIADFCEQAGVNISLLETDDIK